MRTNANDRRLLKIKLGPLVDGVVADLEQAVAKLASYAHCSGLRSGDYFARNKDCGACHGCEVRMFLGLNPGLCPAPQPLPAAPAAWPPSKVASVLPGPPQAREDARAARERINPTPLAPAAPAVEGPVVGYVDLPECPGPECLMCSGEACDKCGAGCWNNQAPFCEHDSADRHEYGGSTPPAETGGRP